MIARLVWLPLASLSAVLLYQTTNAALYHLIGCGIYFWAYCEGEVRDQLLGSVRASADQTPGDMRSPLDITKESGSKTQSQYRSLLTGVVAHVKDDTTCFILHSVGTGVIMGF